MQRSAGLKVFFVVTLLANLQGAILVRSATLPLITIVTNPFPAKGDGFGVSVAAAGENQLLVGAQFDQSGPSAAGAAFLFSADGQRITTFTNPAPADRNEFGISVAVLGTNRVVIGADQESGEANWTGAAYLFNTNGALLKRIANPTPGAGDGFGSAVAVAGDHWLLIGTPGNAVGGTLSGSAFLLDTNGLAIATLTNTAPEAYAELGFSVAALGSDRVIVGAPGDAPGGSWTGAAYLFNTNGILLKRLANPNPGNYAGFGISVAPLGSNSVLVGANGDNTSGADAGIAYLFDTDGTILTTFHNPEPAVVKGFGVSLAAVGPDRVAIGAFLRNGSGTTPPGAVFLFQADGTLLASVTSPNAATNDYFGFSVASAGSGALLIGEPLSDVGAVQSGAAYLFKATPVGPALEIRLNPPGAEVSWVTVEAGWVLQETDDVGKPSAWLDLNGDVVTVGNTNSVNVDLAPVSSAHSFRLRQGP
jgi:hypothetical protein